VRVGVREHLPVEPREPGGGDALGPLLDVRVARVRVEHAALRAVVVLGVEVARAPVRHRRLSALRADARASWVDGPLLHDELFAGRLRLLHVRLERGGREIAWAVGVQRDHVEPRALEPRVLDRLGRPRLAARRDDDLHECSGCRKE
jgi:hypothetical protein